MTAACSAIHDVGTVSSTGRDSSYHNINTQVFGTKAMLRWWSRNRTLKSVPRNNKMKS